VTAAAAATSIHLSLGPFFFFVLLMVYDLFCLFFGTFFSDSGGDMPTVPPSFENGLIVLIVRLFLCLFLV